MLPQRGGVARHLPEDDLPVVLLRQAAVQRRARLVGKQQNTRVPQRVRARVRERVALRQKLL